MSLLGPIFGEWVKHDFLGSAIRADMVEGIVPLVNFFALQCVGLAGKLCASSLCRLSSAAPPGD